MKRSPANLSWSDEICEGRLPDRHEAFANSDVSFRALAFVDKSQILRELFPKIELLHASTLSQGISHAFGARNGHFQICGLPVQLPQASVTMHWRENFDHDEGNVWLRELMTDIVRHFDERLSKA